ncbi:MAG: hypothetical protein WCH52_09390, partial [Bacteroidota bacterium]
IQNLRKTNQVLTNRKKPLSSSIENQIDHPTLLKKTKTHLQRGIASKSYLKSEKIKQTEAKIFNPDFFGVFSFYELEKCG